MARPELYSGYVRNNKKVKIGKSKTKAKQNEFRRIVSREQKEKSTHIQPRNACLSAK